ncbi:MAG: hypothetical protein IPM35_34230 [Myxococcales bacterium]|nr:hypothetical protein [Myxococcales bacterium]
MRRRTAAALVALLALVACHGPEPRRETKPAVQGPDARHAAVEPRSQLLPAYPCSGCHAGREARTQRYELKEFHEVRNHEFSHGEDAFWCFQCHSSKDPDKLVTSNGEMVSFDEAYKICTSCHGDKINDWRNGAHGLIVGNWNGTRTKKSCPACHDPHDPRFPSIKPEAKPAPPKGLKAL